MVGSPRLASTCPTRLVFTRVLQGPEWAYYVRFGLSHAIRRGPPQCRTPSVAPELAFDAGCLGIQCLREVLSLQGEFVLSSVIVLFRTEKVFGFRRLLDYKDCPMISWADTSIPVFDQEVNRSAITASFALTLKVGSL